MADVTKPSPADLSANKNGATTAEKASKIKPEKPDEQLYKDSLAKAEKEHTAAQEKVVRMIPLKAEPSLELHFSTTKSLLLFWQGADLK